MRYYNHCPLCLAESGASIGPATIESLDGPGNTRLLHCSVCDLVFRPREDLPSPEAERKHYLTHENSPDQPGYVRFLRRALDPALPFLEPGMRGVDWGSGPGPALSGLCRAAGLDCHDYDPIFGPHALTPPYDFIFATECVEHMHNPRRDVGHIVSSLAPGGMLTIMTELWMRPPRFTDWRYARDPTHVSFFSDRTMAWLAQHFGLEELYADGSRVNIFRAC